MIEQSHVLDLMLAVAYPQMAYLELQLKRVIFIADTPATSRSSPQTWGRRDFGNFLARSILA